MDPNTLKILQGAAGAAGADPIGVEDVFSTDVWVGNDSARTITTGVDLTDGGMMWFVNRDNSSNVPNLVDTESGINKHLKLGSPGNAAQATSTSRVTAVSSTGYSLGNDSDLNNNNDDCVGWTFKKQKKFFTCLTYSGTGSATTVSHDLGSVPGAIFVKRTDSQSNWYVYHRGMGATKYLQLNSNSAAGTNADRWNDTSPTASVFHLGDQSEVNASTGTYVAYLFAHEEAEFGPNSDQKIISCGSFTGNGSSSNGPTITLPFEPAWIMLKAGTSGGHWYMCDNMRGLRNGSSADTVLKVNSNDAESTTDIFEIKPDGFQIKHNDGEYNSPGETMIYIAIAAENGKTMKAIETGSDVFAIDVRNETQTATPAFDSDFPVDFALMKKPTVAEDWFVNSRLTEDKYLLASLPDAEVSTTYMTYDYNLGFGNAGLDSTYYAWMWKRHAGFDVVTYDGTGSARTQNHNLGVIPEMIWVKCRNTANTFWTVYHKGLNAGTTPHEKAIYLDTNDDETDATTWAWNGTAPTSSVFSLGTDGYVNGSSRTYIAMLFASVDGVSKVGYYTGNGSASGQTITITPGLTPRFIIIKKTSGDKDWWVLDTTRVWGSGNDNYLKLNTDDAQASHDFGAPISTGFTLPDANDAYNGNNENYIYYCHA
tara:strand:+ start:1452 stop:3407 length:1956 start_codon:yes stop_codon:yes gene_type:complete